MQSLDYQQESENIINWIEKVFRDSVQKKIVIGLSGGIDSSLSCALAVQAVGKENIMPILLPYGELSSEGLEDARLVINHLRIPAEQVVEIDVKSGVDAIYQHHCEEQDRSDAAIPSRSAQITHHEIATPFDELRVRNDIEQIRMGNIMARVRMIYLFDLAKQHKALVCGTENKSEHYLGYFTRFGDEASDMEPIRHLYKTQVWEMGKNLGLPEKIITKAPTAGLWAGQTDEQEMGFSYKDADQVLHYFIDQNLRAKEIVSKGLDKTLIEKVLLRVKENEFKHRLPFVFRR